MKEYIARIKDIFAKPTTTIEDAKEFNLLLWKVSDKVGPTFREYNMLMFADV